MLLKIVSSKRGWPRASRPVSALDLAALFMILPAIELSLVTNFRGESFMCEFWWRGVMQTDRGRRGLRSGVVSSCRVGSKMKHISVRSRGLRMSNGRRRHWAKIIEVGTPVEGSQKCGQNGAVSKDVKG